MPDRKFDTQSEHQERDAKIGEQRHLPAVCHEARAVRADHDSGDDVANQNRQPESSRDQSTNDGDAERQKQIDD